MPYLQVIREDMILRDHLAHERTVLANERTLLAYIRTAIAILAAGGTLVELFAAVAFLRILGIVLLALGTLVLVLGGWRFAVVARRLRAAYRQRDAVKPSGKNTQGPRDSDDPPA